MSLIKRSQKYSRVFKLIGYRDGAIAYDITLDKKKLLVGQFRGADISIDDPALSHYHAFITIDENGGRIIDLDSENGIYLNGERVNASYFSAGDIIRIGAIEFHMEELQVEGDVQVEDQDSGKVKALGEKQILEMPSELPPVPGLVVIDGEYCDIVFDDEGFVPVTEPDALKATNLSPHYIDITAENYKSENIIDNNELAVEVTLLSQGQILNIEYLSLKNQTLFATPYAGGKNKIHIPGIDREKALPFVEIKNGNINIHPIPGFEARNIGKEKGVLSVTSPIILNKEDIVDFNQKTIQVMVRITDAPSSIKRAPFFLSEPAFQKEAGKFVGSVMALMLLLLFVNITQDVPEKEKLAIIYRKAIKAPTPTNVKSANQASKSDKDLGVKRNKQDKKPTKMAKKSPTKSKVKPKKSKPKKIAKKKAAAPKKIAVAKKMKAYEFKMTNTLSSLTSASKSITNTKVNSKSRSPSNAKGFKASQASSDSALNAKTAAQVGTLGQDFSGKYDSSSGAKGLASKSGIDTAYTDQETVVLGSMDPELLRKILREYLPQFRHCYQQELERSENAKGVVNLNFRIGKAGRVVKVNIKSKKSKFSKPGTNCMAGVLRLIDFPKPKGGGMVDVRQPLNFFAERSKI